MNLRLLTFAFFLALPVAAIAQEKEAKTLAQEILDKGAALYDARDAGGLTTTYTEDAQILWVEKDNSTGEVKVTSKKGKADIEALYRELFKDPKEQTRSLNTVEYARFVAPDILVVQGVFQPNVAAQGKYPFVQLRVREGDKWLLKNLQLYVISQD